MSEHLALVHALLTPNLRHELPYVIMILMIQGIHPEIIFELIPYVTMSQQQYDAIIMAWTQLSLFASLLPAVKGVKPQTFQGQMFRFSTFSQDRISIVFANFQNSVLKKILVRCGFAGTLPSFDVVQNLASNLTLVRRSSMHIFPIERLFLAPKEHLIVLKTALQMQSMIAHVRSTYPDIASFLAQNENAMKNIITVWRNQLDVKQTSYRCLFDFNEPVKMNDLFIFCMLTVINPEFDQSLVEVIQKCGYPSGPLQDIQKHSEYLKNHCKSVEPMIFGHFLNIGQVLDCFSNIVTSTMMIYVTYTLSPWSIGFGQIVYSGQPEFEKLTIIQESSMPIFDVFSTFWHGFFRNFARTFAVSFLPFGNIPWSEGYTRLFHLNFDWIIRIAVGNFALRIGAKDNHAFLRRKISWLSDCAHSEISTASYGRLIFPDGIRNCKISSEICSCFLRDFWRTHQKPDPSMSDIDYIRWLFSIPGTFAVFGKDWIDLLNALQKGEYPLKKWDGPSFDYRYRHLSFHTDPTDPEIQQEYNEIFGEYFRQLGREIEISDYAEGEALSTTKTSQIFPKK